VKTVEVAGNTYPVRDKLRALGGKWDPGKKVWTVPEDKAEEARTLVASPPPTEQRAYRPSRCKLCGARPNQRGWPRIYRNGVCSDCYADGED